MIYYVKSYRNESLYLFRYSSVVTEDLGKMVCLFLQIKLLVEKIMAVLNAHIILETAFVVYSKDLSIIWIIIVDLKSTVDVEENKDKQSKAHLTSI